MTGRAVRSPVPGSNDVSDLTPGVYLLSARTANGAWRTEAKVVVE
jgi:hypothetical protein